MKSQTELLAAARVRLAAAVAALDAAQVALDEATAGVRDASRGLAHFSKEVGRLRADLTLCVAEPFDKAALDVVLAQPVAKRPVAGGGRR